MSACAKGCKLGIPGSGKEREWSIQPRLFEIMGADTSAGIFSIIETAKENNLVPYKYLE